MINKNFLKADAKKLGLRPFREGGRNPHLSFIIYHLSFIISFLLLPTGVYAQETFTQHLTRQVAGEGRVVLHQDAEIEALVNSPAKHRSNATSVAKPVHSGRTDIDSTALSADPTRELHSGHRSQAVGFRIQVYAGGNSRQAKSEAHRMAGVVRSHFSDVAVYTSFISPRWVCRVGDFKTREEAMEQLRKMRETQQFGEASIVKSKIYVYY